MYYLLAFREEFIFQLCHLKQCSLNNNIHPFLDLIWLSVPHSLRLTLCLFIGNCRDANDAQLFFFFYSLSLDNHVIGRVPTAGKYCRFHYSEGLWLYLCPTVSLQNGVIPDYVTVFWSHSSLVSSGSLYKCPCFTSPLMNSSKHNLQPHPLALNCKTLLPDVDLLPHAHISSIYFGHTAPRSAVLLTLC